MSTLQFEKIAPARPVLDRSSSKDTSGRGAQTDTEVVIIGAGPYGLSLAAYLGAYNIPFRVFGKPLDTWREHMPSDMLLKSEGFASDLEHPSKDSQLKAYCAERNIPYSDTALPVSLDLFLEYADWFQKKYVPSLEEKMVTGLERADHGFTVTLDDGERVKARRVVLAVGITWFPSIPKILSELAPEAVSHSYDHRDVSRFAGKDVVVLGSGASAIDLAALLQDRGAKTTILARDTAIRYHSAPGSDDDKFWNQMRSPSSTIGPGWRSWFAVHLPFLFRYLPESWRLEIVRRHLGPAPGWFMRDRVEGHVEQMLGHTLDAARMMGKRVLLRVTGKRGEAKTVECDHIVAATGYKPDFTRVPFMSKDLLANIATTGGAPKLSAKFETTVPDLYVVGPAAANCFGPLMRFMTGSEFVTPRVAKHLRAKPRG